jgi:hypothetical protein
MRYLLVALFVAACSTPTAPIPGQSEATGSRTATLVVGGRVITSFGIGTDPAALTANGDPVIVFASPHCTVIAFDFLGSDSYWVRREEVASGRLWSLLCKLATSGPADWPQLIDKINPLLT